MTPAPRSLRLLASNTSGSGAEPRSAPGLQEFRVIRDAALDEVLHAFAQGPVAANTSFAGGPVLILTSHIGRGTAEADTRMSAMTARRVAVHLRLD